MAFFAYQYRIGIFRHISRLFTVSFGINVIQHITASPLGIIMKVWLAFSALTLSLNCDIWPLLARLPKFP